MTFVSKNADNSNFKVDMSLNKYLSKHARLLGILLCAGELPNDLYTEMNLSYDYFRKLISDLLRRGLIKRVSRDGMAGYQLTLQGKKLTNELNYMRYREYLEDTDRHYSAKRRRRRRQFAYLYALLDRAGVPYEVFAKPPIEDVDVNDKRIYFYTALEFKRMIGIEAAPIQGIRALGFFIGRGKVVSIYRADYVMPVFGREEFRLSDYVMRYFSASVNTAIMICRSNSSAAHILYQIVEGKSYQKKNVNTAEYKNFFVFPSDDRFLRRLNDVYSDHRQREKNLIERYGINTSDRDAKGRIRFLFGTGFIDDDPVLICAGNVNAVKLKYFVLNAGKTSRLSYILCRYRDLSALQEVAKDTPIKALAFSLADD